MGNPCGQLETRPGPEASLASEQVVEGEVRHHLDAHRQRRLVGEKSGEPGTGSGGTTGGPLPNPEFDSSGPGHAHGVVTHAAGSVVVPYLSEITPWNEAGRNPRVEAHTAVVVFRNERRRVIRPEELHHDVGGACSVDHVAAGLG